MITGNAADFGATAARANKASAGTALQLANLAVGRTAVMEQRTLDGLPISIGTSIRLLAGTSHELAARQLTVSVQGQAVVPDDLINIRHWLWLLPGAPTNTGTTSFIRTFASGSAARPSYAMEIDYAHSPSVASACR